MPEPSLYAFEQAVELPKDLHNKDMPWPEDEPPKLVSADGIATVVTASPVALLTADWHLDQAVWSATRPPSAARFAACPA